MTDKIAPALSPEEWNGEPLQFISCPNFWLHDDGDGLEFFTKDPLQKWKIAFWDEGGRHALAALALHGQPFGFTREDIKDLYTAGEDAGNWPTLKSLIDRIAALLPPEQP